jgi:hypothetical protein
MITLLLPAESGSELDEGQSDGQGRRVARQLARRSQRWFADTLIGRRAKPEMRRQTVR